MAVVRVPLQPELAFCRAVREGDVARAGQLFGIDINCPTCRQGPLHVALTALGARDTLRDQAKNIEKIVAILFASSQQIEVNALRDGQRPLHLAAMIPKDELALKMIQLLLSHGADPALKNDRKQTPGAVAKSDRVARELLSAENAQLRERTAVLEMQRNPDQIAPSQNGCCILL